MESSDSTIRMLAVEKLTDQATLAKIAVNDPNWGVSEMALQRIREPSILAMVATNTHHAETQRNVLLRISDQTVIEKVLEGSEALQVRSTAAGKLTNETILLRLAANDRSPLVRRVAAKRIDELAEQNPNLVLSSDNEGVTQLHKAVLSGHRDVVELLLAKGSNVNATNLFGWTPLHAAANAGYKEMVELLLAHKANINAKDKDQMNRTPLHWAAQQGHRDVVELLLARNASMYGRDRDGHTAGELALAGGFGGITEVLFANQNAMTFLEGWSRLYKGASGREVSDLLGDGWMMSPALVDEQIQLGLPSGIKTGSYELRFDGSGLIYWVLRGSR
jgi:hypothetical protein